MRDYYSRDYKFNPRIRELIEKQRGKQTDLSYVQVENIVFDVFKGTDKKVISTFTDADKDKIIFTIKDKSPNSLNKDGLEKLNLFMTDNVGTEYYEKYLEHCIKNHYKPGKVYMGVKIYNNGVTGLLKLSNLYDLKKGVLINKNYINDLLPFFNNDETSMVYDKDTLIVEEDYTDNIIKFLDKIKETINIDYIYNNYLFVIVCNDEESITTLKDKYGFVCQDILDLKYYKYGE